LALLASSGRSSLQEEQSFDVVVEIGHTDLRRRPRDADRSGEEIHPVLLRSEDMLDMAADFRFGAVRPLHRRKRPVTATA
jgi:hypothetical protein